jgi:hypothetical protein
VRRSNLNFSNLQDSTSSLMPRRSSWNTWIVGFLFALWGFALSAQYAESQGGAVSIAAIPVDFSLEARPNTLLQSTVRVSTSASSQSSEMPRSSGSPPGTKPGVRSSFSLATPSLWGPQPTIPASLPASNWNPKNGQSAGCKAQSNGDWKGGNNARNNAAPGKDIKDLIGAAPCATDAAIGQSSMLGNWADRKAENRDLTTSTSPSSRRITLGLQMTNASANGIVHYQSGSPDAAEPHLSNSLSRRLKAPSSHDSRSSLTDSNPAVLAARAGSSGTPKTERAREMRSMRGGGHHRRGRHGSSTNQQSSEHCSVSESRAPAGNSSGALCEPSLKGETNKAKDLLD